VIRLFAGAMALGSALWALLESTLPLDLHSRLGLSPSGIGFCFAATALAHTITSPLMGRLSDRIGRVRVLRMGLVLVALLLALPALLPKTWLVVGAMMALGSTASFIMSPCSPAVADQVERLGSQSYASAFSILNLSYSFGMMIGPMVGGALVQGVGLPWALGLSGLGFAAYLFAARGISV
jgi:MFS family permease